MPYCTAQQTLLDAQLSEVSDKYHEIEGVISLYQALEGGIQYLFLSSARVKSVIDLSSRTFSVFRGRLSHLSLEEFGHRSQIWEMKIFGNLRNGFF